MYKYSILEKIIFPPTYLNKKKLEESLDGKNILITGASSGIGKQLAYMLADYNVHLILVARSEDKLLAIKNENKKNAKISILKVDLRDDEDLEKMLEYIHEEVKKLDIVVSNAGKSIKRSIYDSLDRYHDFTRTMAVNYFAPVKIILSTIPLLKESKGHIINISTVNALMIPFPKWSAYQASKGAFDIWMRSVSAELNAEDINTTSIYLPLVRTPMILPTTSYESMPAMNPCHVAKIISKSLYTKRKIYKPWWMIFAQLSSVILMGAFNKLMPYVLKKWGKQK